jgi:flagellum-specific ATP synthase
VNLNKATLAQRLTLGRSLIASGVAVEQEGTVHRISRNGLAVDGFRPSLPIGTRINLVSRDRRSSLAEVVSADGSGATATVFEAADGIAVGDHARVLPMTGLRIGPTWLGRVVDPLGRPLDAKGRLGGGPRARNTRALAPPAATRQRLGAPVALGVRVLDAFCTLRDGQRLGLFAASGIGKSTLLAALARAAAFDVTVLGLIGERGRELREFIEDDLGQVALSRSVVVCATSDASPALRREAAYASLAVAEHFRDEGQRVLLLLDSVTRFALACREVGLAAGEPPATRGFPPSVFRELPALLERAGPGGPGAGSVTMVATVLVEGDDHDEPIADAVRGILDGHVVLDRRIAESGRYPAVDVLRSLSRTVPGCQTEMQAQLVTRARRLLAMRAEVADLVRLGAYRAGTDPAVDEAVRLAPRIEAVLQQRKGDSSTLDEAFAALASAMTDASR